MKSLILQSKFTRPAFVAIALLVTVSIFFGITTITHAATQSTPLTTHSSHEHLLTIYDRGTTKVVYTDAATVGQALQEAGISIAKQDTVEPDASYKLVANEYSINIYRARPVIVVDGNVRERIMTAYQTPEQIAASAGITLYPEDWTTLTRIDDLSEGAGLQLTITRATPVTFYLYGEETTIRTHAKTVAEMLQQKGIKLAPSDTLSVPEDQAITANMSIQLWRNGTQTVNVTQPIAFTTQTIQDADEPVGYTDVQTPGIDGSQIVTYQVEMQNGVEVSRTQIQSVVVVQPSQEVDVIGTKLAVGVEYSAEQGSIMSQAGISSSDQQYAAYIVDHEGGWCAVRWQGDSGCIDHGSAPASSGYGLVQATPGAKMASAGSDWLTNPVTQLIWASGYANSRYGGWEGAYEHWVSHHNW